MTVVTAEAESLLFHVKHHEQTNGREQITFVISAKFSNVLHSVFCIITDTIIITDKQRKS